MASITRVALATASHSAGLSPRFEELMDSEKKEDGNAKQKGKKMLAIDTIMMYKKVKDINHLRQLIFDLVAWSLYLVFFFGFIFSFHSIKTASDVTNGLDLYFSTTDNAGKSAPAWVNIQTEPDIWRYIDNVLVETLLFGEEYKLATIKTRVQAAHGRQLRSKGKGSSSSSNTAQTGNNGDASNAISGTAGNADEANATHTGSSFNQAGCDSNHLDENVTLHYIQNSNVVAGGILIIQNRFLPAGLLHNNFRGLCHKNSHFKTLEGKPLPCALYGGHDKHTDEAHGFNDPKVFKDLPGFKWNSASEAAQTGGYHVDGYIIELNINHGQTAQELLALLKRYKDHHWLDEYTQEVVIELALYNNNLKLWSDVRLEAEFHKAGRVTASHHVQTINLEPYNMYNVYNVQRFCFEIGFIIISLFKLVTEIMQCTSVQCNCKRYCSAYNAEGANIGDIVQLLFSFFLIGIWFYDVISPEQRYIKKQVKANTICHPPNLHHLIVWQEDFLLACSFNILIMLMNGLKFLLFFKGSARIWRVVKASLKHIKSLLFPLALVIVFAALFGHAKWGKDLTEWSTLLDSIYTVVQWMFAMYDSNNIYQVISKDPFVHVVEILFMFFITFLTSIILLNVLLAIIVAAWDEVNTDKDEEGLVEDNGLLYYLKLFNTCKSIRRYLFVWKNQDFVDVCRVLKHEHPRAQIERTDFEGLCVQKLGKIKGKEMASWFFNQKGQVITSAMVNKLWGGNDVKPNVQYMFQKMKSKRIERKKSGIKRSFSRIIPL